MMGHYPPAAYRRQFVSFENRAEFAATFGVIQPDQSPKPDAERRMEMFARIRRVIQADYRLIRLPGHARGP